MIFAPSKRPGMGRFFVSGSGLFKKVIFFLKKRLTSPPPCGIILEQSARGRQQKVNIAGWSSLVARRAHNPKVVGSNPAPATTKHLDFIKMLFFFAYKTRGRTAVRPLVCVYIFYSIPCRRCSASSSCSRAALRWSSRRSLLYWKYRSQPFSAMKAWAAGERVSSVTKTTIS